MIDSMLERARAGDEAAFAELTGPYRRELHVHCYRILGSFQDAEPWWLEPYPDALADDSARGPEARYDARESIALSFVAGLQRLPVQQRAVLVLRDVLGFSASETAEMLDSTPAAVSSALQRARAAFRTSQDPGQAALPRSAHEAAVAYQFADALQRGDVDGVMALLTDDVRVIMPPEPFEFRGRAAVTALHEQTQPYWSRYQLVPVTANGQPAFGFYLPDPTAGIYRAGGIMVLTVTGDQISGIARFSDRSLLARFGLPRTLPAG
jgi:RNA polymerase sigma-70 factor (ECF subfamily)